MKKFVWAIAGVAVVGAGALFVGDSWLDSKAEAKVEEELTAAAGVSADVGSADVQLLRKQVAFKDIQIDNFKDFPSDNLLTIDKITLKSPNRSSDTLEIKTALVEGVNIQLDGNMNDVPSSLFSHGLPNLNVEQLGEGFDLATAASGGGATEADNSSSNKGGFTIDELTISSMSVNINLVVPWETEAIQRTIDIPEVTLTNVTDENIGEQLIMNLGDSVIVELQAFFFEDILPGSVEQLTQSLPEEIDLSNIELPEGIELPENIELPNIKLP